MFLEIYVPCLIVSNRDQLFNFLIKVTLCIQKANQKIVHAWSIYSWSRLYMEI